MKLAIPVLLVLCLLAGVLASPAPAMESGKASPSLPTLPTPEDKIRMEADYILACQYTGPGLAYGAINNVYGPPTYVVPSENGMAILGLDYANAAIAWAATSGLWQTTPDPVNHVTGGFVDWIEVTPTPSLTPEVWTRFIDKSFYAIACWNGGYDFRI